MRFKNSVVLTMSLASFVIVYIVLQFIFVIIMSALSSWTDIFWNIFVSTMPIISFILGIFSCIAAHSIAGAVIGKLSNSDYQNLSIAKTHVFVILILSSAYCVFSLISGDTIIPPLAILLPTLYLHKKAKNIETPGGQ